MQPKPLYDATYNLMKKAYYWGLLILQLTSLLDLEEKKDEALLVKSTGKRRKRDKGEMGRRSVVSCLYPSHVIVSIWLC